MKALKAALLAAALAFPVTANAWSVKEMNNVIDQTNFLVDRGCSGTLIDKNKGYVLTAAHCILSQYETVTQNKIDEEGKVKEEKFQVIRPGAVSQKFFAGPNQVQQNSYIYKVIASDRANDLALLQVQTDLKATSAAKIACEAPQRGDEVYAVGNSYAVLYSTVTKGIVSSVQRNYRDLRLAGDLGDNLDAGEHGLTQHSAVIAPGNSGGALYNDKGLFVGVNVRATATGGFSFAVPLEDIQKFLKDHKVEVACSNG